MARNDRAAIAAAEKALAAAHLTLDLAVLDRLLHPGFTILQPDGQLERKGDLIASLQSGERFWEQAQVDDLSVDCTARRRSPTVAGVRVAITAPRALTMRHAFHRSGCGVRAGGKSGLSRGRSAGRRITDR